MQNTFHLFCLIAPALALVQLSLRFALEQGPAKARLGAVWRQEHWLLWNGCSALRERLATPVFCCIVLLWWGAEPINLLLEWYGPVGSPTAFATLRSLALAGLILGKAFCLTRYSGRQLVLGGLAAALWAQGALMSGYGPVSDALLLVFAVKDTRLFAGLASMLAALTFEFAFTVSTALLGLQANLQTTFDTSRARVRMALGYGSYNSCGIAAANLALLWLCLRWKKLRWWDVLGVIGVVIFIDLVPNSRSAELLCLIVLAAALAGRALPRLLQSRWVRAGCAAAAPLLCVFSYLLACLYDPQNPVISRINSLLSGRVQLAWNYLCHDIRSLEATTLFGQPFTTDLCYQVDNSYVYYFFLCGPLFAAMLVLGGGLLCWRLAKSGGADVILLACALGFMAYAIMEKVVYPNLLILLSANALFGGGARPLTLNGPPGPAPAAPPAARRDAPPDSAPAAQQGGEGA